MPKLLVHKKTHSLIIEFNQDVIDAIPKSKVFTHNGKQFTQVYHGEQEVLKLIELGIDAPAPMLHYYEYPKAKGVYEMMDHQKEAAAFMTLHKRCFNLSEPRTGKTYSILMTYDYLKKTGQVDQLIIYSTLSTLSSVWVQSIFDTFPQYTCTTVHGPKKNELFEEDVDILIINHDGVKAFEERIRKKKSISMVAWDEADVLCNSQAQIWKSFNKSLRDDQRVILATGTPTGDGQPTAAWSLAKIVSPDLVPKYFGTFKRQTMIQVTQFKWVPNRESTRMVYDALQPAICFRKKDVLKGIPDITHKRIECDLSDEQKRMFKELRNDMATEYADGTITAVNGADKITKVLQVLLGSLKTEDGSYLNIDCEPRMKVIRECVESAKKKVLIFVPWRGALRHYFKELSKTHNCAYVDGSVSKNKRDQIFSDFEHGKDLKVLLAHQRTTAHGLEFSCADVIIWAGPPNSGRQFSQANERNNSIKQDSEMTTFYLGASKLEWGVYDRLLEKKRVQDDVLDLYKIVLDIK